MEQERIRMAMQKSGRLSEQSISLLTSCGLSFEWAKDKLSSRCLNFPVDVMFVRDDDIPKYVEDGVCDLGVVGLNVLEEKLGRIKSSTAQRVSVLRRLGFGRCRLSLALPTEHAFASLQSLAGLRIATSYPRTLSLFLEEHGVSAQIVEISGSVEVAPALKIADAICDLVSSGSTLRSNGLSEVAIVLESEAVLAKTRKHLSPTKELEIDRLMQRINGVMKASHTKYIMMNAPRTALARIKAMLPGMETPSILTLDGEGDRIAIHAVSHENIFWETMENLKAAGASSILVLPIEKIIQ